MRPWRWSPSRVSLSPASCTSPVWSSEHQSHSDRESSGGSQNGRLANAKAWWQCPPKPSWSLSSVSFWNIYIRVYHLSELENVQVWTPRICFALLARELRARHSPKCQKTQNSLSRMTVCPISRSTKQTLYIFPKHPDFSLLGLYSNMPTIVSILFLSRLERFLLSAGKLDIKGEISC